MFVNLGCGKCLEVLNIFRTSKCGKCSQNGLFGCGNSTQGHLVLVGCIELSVLFSEVVGLSLSNVQK